MLYNQGFSVKGKEYETVIENNESEVANFAPKIYFNFEHVYKHIVIYYPKDLKDDELSL
jgi:hypothetical protein